MSRAEPNRKKARLTRGRFQLWASANGVVLVRSKREPKPEGFLPFYSTETREAAERLIVRFCKLSRADNETYFLSPFAAHDLDELDRYGERFEAEERRVNVPKE